MVFPLPESPGKKKKNIISVISVPSVVNIPLSLVNYFFIYFYSKAYAMWVENFYIY